MHLNKSVIVLDKVYDEVKAEFDARGAYILKGEENSSKKVRSIILNEKGALNANIVGKAPNGK